MCDINVASAQRARCLKIARGNVNGCHSYKLHLVKELQVYFNAYF